jgi:hypothetical protein
MRLPSQLHEFEWTSCLPGNKQVLPPASLVRRQYRYAQELLLQKQTLVADGNGTVPAVEQVVYWSLTELLVMRCEWIDRKESDGNIGPIRPCRKLLN